MDLQVINDRAPLTVELEDGIAHRMGNGVIVVMQRDLTTKRRLMQNVVLTRRDLEALQSAAGAMTIGLEDGEAFHMGGGSFVVMQRDESIRGRRMQNVALSANDTAAMLAAA